VHKGKAAGLAGVGGAAGQVHVGHLAVLAEQTPQALRLAEGLQAAQGGGVQASCELLSPNRID